MGTRNAVERRKAAGKHRKESFSVKLEVVAKYEPQANKSFLIQQFFKNVGEVWASSPHLQSKLSLQSVFPAAIAFFETVQFK